MSIIPIQKTDTLRISVWASKVGVVLHIVLDIRLRNGECLRNVYVFSPNSNRTESVFSVPLPDGELRSCVVYCSTPYVFRGRCYVRAVIHQGSVWQDQPHVVLFSDYITSSSPLSLSGSFIRSSVEGPGYLGVVSSSLGSTYTSYTISVPALALWNIRFLVCNVVISAEVGDRLVICSVMDDGNNVMYTSTHRTPLSAAGTYNVNFSAACATEFASATQVNIPIPTDLRMPMYNKMRVEILGNLAGDYIVDVVYRYEEWLLV